MDTLDYAILRQFMHPGTFQWDVRISNRDVAEAVGVDEETVRQRIRRLSERGILVRWSIALHPALLGRRMYRLELPALTGPARARAFDGLAAMGNVYHLFDFYGGRLALVVYAEEGAAFERQLALVGALWAPPTSVAEMRLPPPTVEPTVTDWKVLRALREDARAPYATIAKHAGLSERTVRRSVERLIEGRAMWLSPIAEMERAEGTIPTAIRIFYADPAMRAAVDGRLKALDGIIFATHYPDQTQLSYGARRLAEAEELREELARMPGVARVEVDIMIRRVTVDGWMDEIIARRIKESTDG